MKRSLCGLKNNSIISLCNAYTCWLSFSYFLWILSLEKLFAESRARFMHLGWGLRSLSQATAQKWNQFDSKISSTRFSSNSMSWILIIPLSWRDCGANQACLIYFHCDFYSRRPILVFAVSISLSAQITKLRFNFMSREKSYRRAIIKSLFWIIKTIYGCWLSIKIHALRYQNANVWVSLSFLHEANISERYLARWEVVIESKFTAIIS